MIGKPTRGKAVNVEEAIRLYKQGYSMSAVGRILGHHHGVIAYHLYKNNIPIKRIRLRHPEIATEYLKNLYIQGMSTVEISEKVKLSPQSIHACLLKAGIELRSPSEAIKLAGKRGRKKHQFGKDNSQWKGGRYVDKDGYVELRIGGKQVSEHRFVWEKHHGKIPEGWIVHHLNGNRADNRIENLAAMPRKRHSPTKIIEPYRERILQLEAEIDNFEKELKMETKKQGRANDGTN